MLLMYVKSLAYSQLAFLLMLYLYLGTADFSAQAAGGFNDKIAHALAYAVLMCSGVFAFPRRACLGPLAAVFCSYSLLIELIQYFLPHRTFSLMDMLANGVGIAAGAVLGLLLLPVIVAIYRYVQ
ncbi:MAG: VanZ family protein [Cellvibrionaceae bacterium]|nr:VanZ family protein [Cellvibrionaceae bacterium]